MFYKIIFSNKFDLFWTGTRFLSIYSDPIEPLVVPGNTKGGSIIVLLTSSLTGLD